MISPKILFILGTRPELIKLSPVIRACMKQNIIYKLIHTGQHYSYELNEQIFKDLDLPTPDYNLHVGSAPQGEQTGKMLIGIEPILLREIPDVVIVLGDPNSAFAGALAAAKLHIPVCRIEAGRRSFDKTMPEELNRLMIDQISDLLFTPNELTRQNLLREGITDDRIIVSGDTNVDAVEMHKCIAKQKSRALETFGVSPRKYFLATIHRPENADDVAVLSEILTAFNGLAREYQYPVIFAAHPRTQKVIDQYCLKTEGILLTKPLGYLDFLRLEMDCVVLLTDSGSLQEEACILHVPCVTIRNDTERPETITIGANILAHPNSESILSGVKAMIGCDKNWRNPFGDVGIGEHIINEIQYKYRKIE